MDEISQSFPLALNQVTSTDQFAQLQERLRMAVHLAHMEISALQQTIQEMKFQNELLRNHLEQQEKARANFPITQEHHLDGVPEQPSKDDLPLNSWHQQDHTGEFSWPSASVRAEEHFLSSRIFDEVDCIDTAEAY
jgi:DNA-directed RNA polymerase specialized sigma54-like protein